MIAPNSNNSTDQDLLKAKAQYLALKSRVREQPILTPQIINRAINSETKSLKRLVITSGIFAAVGIILWIGLSLLWNLSATFAILTVLLIALDWLGDNWCVWPLRNACNPSTTLIQAAQMLRKSKRRITGCFIAGVTLLIPWIMWMAYEFLHSNALAIYDDPIFIYGTIGGGIIGGFIGILIATIVIRKHHRAISALSANIRDTLASA